MSEVIELGLTLVATGAFCWLAIARYRSADHRRITIAPNSRLLLADGLLVIAGVEMVADSVLVAVGRDTPLGDMAAAIAIVGRGALIAGALALLVTFPERAQP